MNVIRFVQGVYHDNRARRQGRRSLPGDLLRYGRNRLLQPIDAMLRQSVCDPTLPIGFILGTPRSGTTLLFQLMARHLNVAFPSNDVARYWSAPVVGTWIHLRQDKVKPHPITLASAFGGTEEPYAPHEFSWFWQFHTGFRTTDALTEQELDRVRWSTVRRQAEALAGLHRLPYIFKSLNHTVYHVPRLARELRQSRYIYIRRDPRFVVQSILETRIKRYGREDIWWSVRPRDVAEWRGRDPIEQVCHQVTDIQRAIEAGLRTLPPERKRVIDYERLVANPESTLAEIADLLGTSWRDRAGVASLGLRSANVPRMNSRDIDRATALLEQDG